ncbi:helix-turn-helix transcriptional regulator [Polyangium sp. 6x1]|uniref:helix-turn-helix domain-containing protein n=1 Tax=Polyangium sp. 6x1 TaxID=3042689 RepID=UPI002482B277|nr:helix-turn-helix transcriptional regulator [Polyangium sp. 6x1]MDI1445947.1 helix-turn-helix transcriptional regulator [Polyangium sp. 6x1]
MKRDEGKRVTGAFGAAVRAARLRQGVSQEALADLCELDRTYISGVERGIRNPTVLSIWRIASALHVRPSDLFRDAESTLLPDDEEA